MYVAGSKLKSNIKKTFVKYFQKFSYMLNVIYGCSIRVFYYTECEYSILGLIYSKELCLIKIGVSAQYHVITLNNAHFF